LLGRGSVDDTGPTAGRGGFSGFSGVEPDGGGGGSFGDAPGAGGTGAGLFFLRAAGLGLPCGGLKVEDLKSECKGSVYIWGKNKMILCDCQVNMKVKTMTLYNDKSSEETKTSCL
jgi:hypothetical protein